jgi:hypothetical protein
MRKSDSVFYRSHRKTRFVNRLPALNASGKNQPNGHSE